VGGVLNPPCKERPKIENTGLFSGERIALKKNRQSKKCPPPSALCFDLKSDFAVFEVHLLRNAQKRNKNDPRGKKRKLQRDRRR
jgi:hypothetical protein